MYAHHLFPLTFAERPSAEPLRQVGVGYTLKDPWGVCPHLGEGYGTFTFFAPCNQTLLNQFQRDDNVRTLLEAIRNAFEFSKEADILRNIQPASKQAKILDEMLQCVTRSAEFIESYAKDVQVGTSSWPLSSLLIINLFNSGKRTWKNIGGQVDGKVEDYRTALARLREEFLAHATITIEATVLQTRVDMSQTQVDVSQTRVDVGRVKAQLGDISNQALEAGA
jgi:hypothetical protein